MNLRFLHISLLNFDQSFSHFSSNNVTHFLVLVSFLSFFFFFFVMLSPTSICWFVGRITKKLVYGFPWNRTIFLTLCIIDKAILLCDIFINFSYPRSGVIQGYQVQWSTFMHMNHWNSGLQITWITCEEGITKKYLHRHKSTVFS